MLAMASLTSVIDAANDALSKEPVPIAAASIISTLPAKAESESVNVVLTVLILDARDALFVFTVLTIVSILCAADELLVVTVPCMVVILDASEELFVFTEL